MGCRYVSNMMDFICTSGFFGLRQPSLTMVVYRVFDYTCVFYILLTSFHCEAN